MRYTETAILTGSGGVSVCLYVFSPSRHDRLYQLQAETLSERRSTLNEHHITIAEVFEDDCSHIGDVEVSCYNSEELRRQFHISPGQFKVVLAGDSGVKLSTESCISCEEVIMRTENQPAEPKHSF